MGGSSSRGNRIHTLGCRLHIPLLKKRYESSARVPNHLNLRNQCHFVHFEQHSPPAREPIQFWHLRVQIQLQRSVFHYSCTFTHKIKKRSNFHVAAFFGGAVFQMEASSRFIDDSVRNGGPVDLPLARKPRQATSKINVLERRLSLCLHSGNLFELVGRVETFDRKLHRLTAGLAAERLPQQLEGRDHRFQTNCRKGKQLAGHRTSRCTGI